MFEKILDKLNIKPDNNQKWVLFMNRYIKITENGYNRRL